MSDTIKETKPVTSQIYTKTVRVHAIRITAENLAQLAKEVGGEVSKSFMTGREGIYTPYVGTGAGGYLGEAGDWVVLEGGQFRAYDDYSFQKMYTLDGAA